VTAPRICILDYGMGNLRSVEKALERVGATTEISAEVARAEDADGLVLPGVGAFPAAMSRVRRLGFDRLAREWVDAGRPLLGICLGMQLLFEFSDENGGDEGIGVLEGQVRGLEAPGLKVPHIGWEPVRWERESALAPDGLGPETPFYFVHSFAAHPPRREDVAATAAWGERFACVVERERTFGVQFHPEKSSTAGLRLLAGFTAVCAPVATG
jgi:glutamine amidotransferase